MEMNVFESSFLLPNSVPYDEVNAPPELRMMSLDLWGTLRDTVQLMVDTNSFDTTPVSPSNAVRTDADLGGSTVVYQQGQEQIATCTTCPAFSMCDNRTKLAPASTKNTTLFIEYEPTVEHQVEIHSHQRFSYRETSRETSNFGILMSLSDQRLARHGSKVDNIFMQLQDFPTPVGSPSNLENLEMSLILPVSIPPLLPRPDDLPCNDQDGLIFSFRMDAFLGFGQILSSAYKTLYLLSSASPPLRHVLLAFLTYLNDDDRASKGAFCKMHLCKAVPEIQTAISNLDVHESHILAVPLLAYLAFWWRQYDTAKAHLKGFYNILLHMRYIREDKHGNAHVLGNMPSIVLLMWRLAVRLDHYFTFLRPEVELLPPIKVAEGTSRRFVTDFIDPSSFEWLECLVFEDELEDLRHLTSHYNSRANKLAASRKYGSLHSKGYIAQAANKIVRKLNTHRESILTSAVKFHTKHQPFYPPAGFTTEAFSGNASPIPFHTLHPRFLEVIIMNRATAIQATISSHPTAGPTPSERVQAAEEICWAFKALKEMLPMAMHGRGRILEALLFSGYAFCSIDYFFEFQWVKRRLHGEMDEGHVGATKMDYMLDLAWQNPDRTFWDLIKLAVLR